METVPDSAIADAASTEVAPGEAAAAGTAPGDVAPGDGARGDVARGDVARGEAAPMSVAPGGGSAWDVESTAPAANEHEPSGPDSVSVVAPGVIERPAAVTRPESAEPSATAGDPARGDLHNPTDGWHEAPSAPQEQTAGLMDTPAMAPLVATGDAAGSGAELGPDDERMAETGHPDGEPDEAKVVEVEVPGAGSELTDAVAQSAPPDLDGDSLGMVSASASIRGTEPLSDVSEDSLLVREPVDSPVDDGAEIEASEREMGISEVGENAVDDRIGAHRFGSRTVERDALATTPSVDDDDAPHARELAENAHRRIQLTGRPFPKPAAPRVLTVANQKGGVGKTTTTVNVAAALAQAGLRALVIDLDPQGNASTALGIDHHAEVPSIYDVLVEGTPLLEVIQPCTTVDNLYCAPATIDLAGAEIELVSLVARESRLQKAIVAATETGHSFDYILIDCPPSLGLLTVNAMVAASEVFIPIQCEYYALEGLSQLLKNIELVKAHLNPPLHVSTILLTMYDGRTRLSAQVADEVREHFPEQVLRTTVPRSVRVSEAPSFGETVMTYDPTSSGALAYLEAAGEIADRGAQGRV
ncbi:AAA family ATPase [Monashia sp. NPDC004114]